MTRFASRFSRDAAGTVTARAPKAPHCVFCGSTGELLSVKVPLATSDGRISHRRVDVCAPCKVNRLGKAAAVEVG